jgi:hypothetical protein
MSGGKGIISTYTRRFKDRYKKFIGISDGDDTKKIKKLEAWGGLTGIYKFLKVDEKKYKNATGDELSALEKMKENIRTNTNSSNNEGYLSAIKCLEENGDNILLNEKCVSYNVFVNGGEADDEVGDAATEAAAEDAATEDVVDDDAAAKAEVVVAPAVAAKDDAADVEDAAPAVAADDDDTEAAAAKDDAADVEDAAPAVAADDDDTLDADSAKTNAAVTNTLDEPGSVYKGGSKRRPKSSRRVKFSKSKKGRTTRRRMRKNRR